MAKSSMREAMPFPFRWFESLRKLDDREFRMIFDAIGAYAEHGEEPQFSGMLAALWHELRDRMDYDRKQYNAVCERNRINGRLGGRPKKTERPE